MEIIVAYGMRDAFPSLSTFYSDWNELLEISTYEKNLKDCIVEFF